MSAEMQERIAIAFWMAAGSPVLGPPKLAFRWHELTPELQQHYRILAKAMLQTMKEPTKDMLWAAKDVELTGNKITDAYLIWAAMLKEALR